ncbi:MAG: glycoside hydrolase family 97 protein [Bacteroidaceae bacterium]|nr:glycoside hydrolase family 97 protein [Bacteroidaceae bacterium]
MKRYSSFLLCCLLSLTALATEIPGKKLFIPKELRNNDFGSDTARWSYSRMALTENFVIFWERGFGNDLNNPPMLEGKPMRVDLENLKQKLEEFYKYYRDTLHFIGPGSNAAKYRMMVMLNYSLEGTAYGGDYDEFIGAFWVAPNRLQDRALNCVAHELGHSFQMQVHCDKKAKAGRASTATDQFIDTQHAELPEEGRWFGGGFFEMTSQWMLWHVNPYWVRDELFHWQAYQRTPHKAFLDWENIYHSPYVLEWWAQNHGTDIIGDIYKTAKNPEDPADAFMRLAKMPLKKFYDDLFEANRHTIFLDFRHAHKETRPYAGHWPQMPTAGAPEAGGFDARLMPKPAPGESIEVEFSGKKKSDDAGWRYGFAAMMDDGSCQYSPIYSKSSGRISYTAPRKGRVSELYLVVMGAPSERRKTGGSRRILNGQPEIYPYELHVTASGHLVSPDGHLSLDVRLKDSQVAYSVNLDGKPLLADCRAALVFDGKRGNIRLKSVSRESKSEEIDAFAYRQKRFGIRWNAATYRLTSDLEIEFRAFGEGIAYRFIQTGKSPRVVKDEIAAFVPSGDPMTYLAYSTNRQKPEAMAFQNIYTSGRLSEMEDRWAFMPATMDLGHGVKITLLESDLESYPGMFLRPVGDRLQSSFAHYPKTIERGRYRGMTHVSDTEDFIAKSAGARTYPWRILNVTTDDRQMPTSNLVYALASPSRVADTSWIRTGKSSWDWWHAWNLKGVGFKAGINMDTYKYYIDFASEYGLEYAILDEGWYNSDRGEIMQSIPDIDVAELVEYGRRKGVGIILWTVFNVLDEHLDEACKKYAGMGVKGFKVDFLDRDDQTAVEMAYRIAETCARHHLILDYHGFWKPTGLNRTYPNLVNTESVFGMEEMKWNSDKKDMPLYDVTFPYIRGMAGFVDYTPGAMRNASLKNFRDIYDSPMSMGTRCHQLAAYVIHDSPLTMLADAASAYKAEPEYTHFLASIPNNVDETRVIAGKMGEYIVVARRRGSTWWIGGQTNWQPRTIELDLSTLGLNGKHSTTVYADGPNAGSNAEDYAVSRLVIGETPDGKGLQHKNPWAMPLSMAGGGGFVIKIE